MSRPDRIQVKSTLKQRTDPKLHYQFQLARGLSSKKGYSADDIDFFVCCCITDMKFWVIPFEAATVTTLKIYNGEDSKFHRYEDAWILLEK